MYKYLLILLLVSCGSRKVEQVKEIEKVKSIEKLETISNEWFKEFEFNAIKESNYTFIREFSESGKLAKETYSKNDKASNSSKSKHYVKNITNITYKTVTTYKSVKTKVSDKKETSKSWLVWIGLFIVIAGLIYFLIIKYKPKITDLLKH